jgi:hypothetical protein
MLPGVVPMTSFPASTVVVTRSSRLSSAETTTDCSAPTWMVTLLLPARSTAAKGATSRDSVAGTPEPSTPTPDDLSATSPWIS